jgi:hypothetical protein
MFRRVSKSGWIIRAIVGMALLALVAGAGSHWPARAQTDRFVSPFGDDLGGANDCSSPDQPCKTIQQAVNQSGSGDLIELAGGTYFENVTVSQSVTIQGDAFNPSIVNGGAAGPVFLINSGNTVALTMLTITNGSAGDAAGNVGGGIKNNGGSLMVVQCTINGNTATGSGSGGGGIFNSASGTLTVINSTISGNQDTGTNGGGGGVFNSGTATLVNTTINGNTATGTNAAGGGILSAGGATLNFTNTIVSGSGTSGDCDNLGTIGTNSHNLVQDGSCSPAVSGNPKLGPLANNGGPTFTHALMAGSPAIDAGDDSVVDPMGTYMLTTDQRGNGFPRKVCTHVDIGAYEFGGGVAPTVNCPNNISTFSDPGTSTASVSFNVTASDLCDGALTPTCKIGGTPITSPHVFPAGVTTVTCSATNSQSLTGMCSFNVTVSLLNVCIQDDHSGDTFRFNGQTGAYVYTRCRDKFTLTGTGVARTVNGTATLTDSRADRRINAALNLSQMTGRANITLISPGLYQTITVSQTNPHATCKCP